MKLSATNARKLAKLHDETQKDCDKERDAFIAKHGEQAYLTPLYGKERDAYNLGWEQAKSVGIDYAIRAIFGSEGIELVCKEYDTLVGLCDRCGAKPCVCDVAID